MNGTIIGGDALKNKWREWCIVLMGGARFVGRVRPQAGVPGSTRRLSPVYDLVSGFQPTPQGLQEVHKAYPLMALTIKGIDLPDHGCVLIPLSELEKMELEGMAEMIAAAEDLEQQMKAARSNIVIAPPGAIPPPKS